MSTTLFKDLKNGFYMCNICAVQVKAKIWTAHANGRKHRENVEKFKRAVAGSQKAAAKRKLEAEEQVESKKHKESSSDEDEEEEKEQPQYSAKTPWQVEVAEKNNEHKIMSSSVKVIEGVPEGFFDNQDMNSRVRGTMEKQKNLESEVEKFLKEVAEEDNQKEEVEDAEIETNAVQKELELIDEQMERWKAINELEIKKEETLEKAKNFNQKPNFDPMEQDESDSDEDFDFNSIDWRTKVPEGGLMLQEARAWLDVYQDDEIDAEQDEENGYLSDDSLNFEFDG
uniref:U1-type domain-containing protein n=1 Tax=Ditylenchus dipsaci TaxID=166011 RepID=A0A915DUM5_9BILA